MYFQESVLTLFVIWEPDKQRKTNVLHFERNIYEKKNLIFLSLSLSVFFSRWIRVKTKRLFWHFPSHQDFLKSYLIYILTTTTTTNLLSLYKRGHHLCRFFLNENENHIYFYTRQILEKISLWLYNFKLKTDILFHKDHHCIFSI